MKINLNELKSAINMMFQCRTDYLLSVPQTKTADCAWSSASRVYITLMCNTLCLSEYRTLNFFKAILRHEKKTGRYIKLYRRREDILAYLAR